ncbi:MAG: hypothetical protein KJ674_03050 [Nanoarchaeota archaeon]|nr:hypothetical protein [Nanoarchaeota archaeon]
MDKREEEILNRYKKKLGEKVELDVEDYNPESFSQEYNIFKKEALTTRLSFYEKLCRSFGGIFSIKPSEKDYLRLKRSIDTIHLNINPKEASGFGVFIGLLLVFIGIFAGVFVFFINEIFDLNILLIPLLFLLTGVLVIKPLGNIPIYSANKWRLKASNQMVVCILYIVMYMRHTSNLEHAIRFAADHVGNPLALDLRKVFWDVENGKYSTMKESLDSYLVGWRDHSLEFVESFHLIEGSLFEKGEDRRLTLLDKALDVMLNGTYEKMLHYAQDLKNPITILHMLGVVLPILGLVILPLVGSLMGGSGFTKVIVIVVLYNVLLPLVVYIIGMNVLSKRPTGYSDANLIESNPDLKKYGNILINIGNKELQFSPFFISFLIFFLIAFIGVLPIIMYFLGVDFSFFGGMFLDYRLGSGVACQLGETCYGPFGAGAVLLSLFLPLGLALGIGTYYRIKTKKLMKIVDETKKLEREFSGSLFQLGNRIGDGVPTELAFGDVAKSMSGTPTGDFFKIVSVNLMKLGVGIERAIFDRKVGAMWRYPSGLIESSMKVLIQGAKKGPSVASKSLISISQYVDRIHQVNERLKDLLSDIVSSMKSQIGFLTPIISGIVVGISTMIVLVLGRLSTLMAQSSLEGGDTSFGGLGGLSGLFEVANIIPGYYLQLVVGIYVVEVIIILTFLANGIENGNDKLTAKYMVSKNLYTSGLLYFIVALLVTLIFSYLAMNINLTTV